MGHPHLAIIDIDGSGSGSSLSKSGDTHLPTSGIVTVTVCCDGSSQVIVTSCLQLLPPVTNSPVSGLGPDRHVYLSQDL